jgi:hypothetical protein
MAIGNLYHSGFISSIKYDNLTPWYTTTSDNQVIEFKETDGQQRHLNSLFIETEATALYIRILPTDYCLYVPANSSINYDFEDVKSIQIMNVAGVKLRWSGLHF